MGRIVMGKDIFIWGANPENLRGGPEVLCLLCDTLNKMGFNAKMFNWEYEDYQIPQEFSEHYSVKTCNWKDIYTKGSSVILPELLIQQQEDRLYALLDGFKEQNVYIWFLSSDFTGIIDTTWQKIVKVLKTYKNITYLCESRWAWEHLEFYGIKSNKFMLQHGTTPIFTELGSVSEKENRMCFNALKYENIVKLDEIRHKTDIHCIGIGETSFLTKKQMCDIFDKSKVYVDFCGFLGREMTPREACLRDCVLLLGNEGCASFFEDYPIPDFYKLDPNCSYQEIVEKIDYIFKNYDKCLEDMKIMKNKCLMEYCNFVSQLRVIFGYESFIFF